MEGIEPHVEVRSDRESGSSLSQYVARGLTLEMYFREVNFLLVAYFDVEGGKFVRISHHVKWTNLSLLCKLLNIACFGSFSLDDSLNHAFYHVLHCLFCMADILRR